MLRYHVAYFLPRGDDRMVGAEVLDFPGVVSQGFDLADARLMIASALEEIWQMHLEEGKALPVPNPDAMAADADLIELLIFRAMVAVSNAKEVRGKICPGSSCSQILDGLKMRLRL
jgi:predicted RNase H-like HicB family nuclease